MRKGFVIPRFYGLKRWKITGFKIIYLFVIIYVWNMKAFCFLIRYFALSFFVMIFFFFLFSCMFETVYPPVTKQVPEVLVCWWIGDLAMLVTVAILCIGSALSANLIKTMFRVLQQRKQLIINWIFCSDGAGRTGVLCSLVNLLERLKREERIDVFRSVKDLRDCRPLMVRSKVMFFSTCWHPCFDWLLSFKLNLWTVWSLLLETSAS